MKELHRALGLIQAHAHLLVYDLLFWFQVEIAFVIVAFLCRLVPRRRVASDERLPVLLTDPDVVRVGETGSNADEGAISKSISY